MTAPKEDTGNGLEYADEEEGSQEGDGGGYAETLKGPSSIGRKAHDDGDVAAGQEIPNRWEAEHSKANGDYPMEDGGNSN